MNVIEACNPLGHLIRAYGQINNDLFPPKGGLRVVILNDP